MKSCGSEMRGHVLEGGSTNIFMVKGNTLVTPPLGERILAGVTHRKYSHRREGELEREIRPIHLDEWMTGDECFLTGTTTEVLGISHVDGQVIGAGQPGPVTGNSEPVYGREWSTELRRFGRTESGQNHARENG